METVRLTWLPTPLDELSPAWPKTGGAFVSSPDTRPSVPCANASAVVGCPRSHAYSQSVPWLLATSRAVLIST
jgi:hypothetical protein